MVPWVLADAVTHSYYGLDAVPGASQVTSFSSHNDPFVDAIFSPNLQKRRPW